MKKCLLALMSSVLLMVFISSVCESHEIVRWRDNRSAAVSITFDDGYLSQPTTGRDQLNARNLKGTFFLMTDTINWAGLSWEMWRNVALDGHEIASHTLTHPFLTELTEEGIREELAGSQAEIDANIPTQSCLTLAYPNGNYDDLVMDVATDYYISARTVWTPDDLNYYPGDGYNDIEFIETGGFSMDEASLTTVTSLLDLAESRSAWLVTFSHDIDPDSYPDRYAVFEGFLDELLERDIWVDTFGAVTRYMKERIHSDLTVVSETNDNIVLNLSHDLDPAIFNEPVTLRSPVPVSWLLVGIQQGGDAFQATPEVEGNETVVYYNAVPNGGVITLTADSLPTTPMIAVQPSALSPTYAVGTDATAQTFEVWNAGPETLRYAVTTDEAWLSCNVQTGTSSGERDTIAVQYSTAALTSGTYSATITISDAAAGNSPLTVPVLLTVLDSDAVLSLNFDEGSGTIAFDWSGNANHGVIDGAQYSDDRPKGLYSLLFNGTSSRVTCPYDPVLRPQDIGVSLWVKPTASPSYAGILQGACGNGYSNGFRLLNASGMPLLQINFGDSSPVNLWGSTLPLNEWSHIAFIYDHQSIRLYQNGALEATLSETRDINWNVSSGDLIIGFAQWYFQGLIDDVRVYEYALTETERCDFSDPKDSDIDGRDLYDFISEYSAVYTTGSPGDIDEDGDIDQDDVALFAENFGSTYTTSTANIIVSGTDPNTVSKTVSVNLTVNKPTAAQGQP